MRTIRKFLLPVGLFALVSTTAFSANVSANSFYTVSDLFYNSRDSWNYLNAQNWYLEEISQENLPALLAGTYEADYLHSLSRTEQQFYSLDAEASYSCMSDGFEFSNVILK